MQIFGVLRHYDIPELAAAVAQGDDDDDDDDGLVAKGREVLVAAPLGPSGWPLDWNEATNTFRCAIRRFPATWGGAQTRAHFLLVACWFDVLFWVH